MAEKRPAGLIIIGVLEIEKCTSGGIFYANMPVSVYHIL